MRRPPVPPPFVLAVLLVWLAGALSGLVLAEPATAHSYLKSVEPADGAVLDSAPAELRLTFNEDALAGTAQLRLTGPAGLVETPVQVDGHVVSAPLPADLSDGGYTLLWRVTSADGHPISGRTTFAVGEAPASAPVAVVEAQPEAATPAQTPVNPLDPASADGPGVSLALILGAVLAAGAGVGVLYAKIRRPGPGPDGTAER